MGGREFTNALFRYSGRAQPVLFTEKQRAASVHARIELSIVRHERRETEVDPNRFHKGVNFHRSSRVTR